MLNSKFEETVNKIEGLAMVPKDEKNNRPKYEEFVPEDMPADEANKKMEEFFQKLEGELKDVPQSVIEGGAEKVIDFIKGNVSWAEMFNFTPDILKQMAELGYIKFQAGRFDEAERFYKVLCVLDAKNSYFHSMLGSILQRQNRHGEAAVQFTEAIDINPRDIVSFVNRGEILLQHGWLNDAELDFKKAISLDPGNEDKWANRARVMMSQIEEIRKRRKLAKKEEKAKKQEGENK